MKILFIHPNMPGQYKHLARTLAADPKNQVVFLTKRRNVKIPGVFCAIYSVTRQPSRETHRYLQPAERGIVQGQHVWRLCRKLKVEKSFVPDVICAHPGWGDALFIKDIYPDAPLLSFFEFYYNSHGADVGFDPAEKVSEDDRARIRAKNIINLLSLESADWGITPTHWQHVQHPPEFRSKISVIHDGIDTDQMVPDKTVSVALPNGKIFKPGDEVVTHVARNFEPYRGFPTFMHAAELILKRRPNCHIIAVGADGVSYGKRPPKGTTYRELLSKQVKLDPERIHFTGSLPYSAYLKVLQVSSAHIYLTYPFVLSWSMLEAMSAGCLVIGSSTAPVTEVIEHGKNGLLADFFSPKEVADRVDEVFAHKDRMQNLRENARQTILDRYDLKKLMPLHIGLVKDIAEKKIPPPTAKKITALYT